MGLVIFRRESKTDNQASERMTYGTGHALIVSALRIRPDETHPTHLTDLPYQTIGQLTSQDLR